jgi:hypothetical protein
MSSSSSAPGLVGRIPNHLLIPTVQHLERCFESDPHVSVQPEVLLALHQRLVKLATTEWSDLPRLMRLSMIRSLCSSPSVLTELVNREIPHASTAAQRANLTATVADSKALSWESVKHLDAEFVLDVLWQIGLDVSRCLPQWSIETPLHAVEACAALKTVLALEQADQGAQDIYGQDVYDQDVYGQSRSFEELVLFIESSSPPPPSLIPLALAASAEALRSPKPTEHFVAVLAPLKSSSQLADTVVALLDHGTPGSLEDLVLVAIDLQSA